MCSVGAEDVSKTLIVFTIFKAEIEMTNASGIMSHGLAIETVSDDRCNCNIRRRNLAFLLYCVMLLAGLMILVQHVQYIIHSQLHV